MRMVGYGRVSTDHEEQRDSLEHQQAFFQDFARARGHTLVRVYSDQGISGKWLKKRDGFLQMLRDAERGEFELVVVKDISRFARNTVDSLESIRRLKALGIECIFVNNSLKVLGESEFIVTIMAAIAQEESANLSKRVKFGKDITSRKGRVPPRIYGYDRLDNFTLRIVPAEAEVVREIFRLYLQGLGCRKIAQALEERGASTKLGASWNSRGVRRVLENPIYCGHYVNHKYTVSDFLSGQIQRLPPDMHYHHDRPEWAIVSPDTFQEAARLMEQRRRQSGSAPPTRYSGRYPLSTLIRCQSCGRAFTRRRVAYPSGRQYVYWHCPIHSEYAGSRCGNGTILPEEGLLDQLRAWLAAQISSPAALAEAVRLRLDARSSRPAEDPAAALRRRLDQLEGQRSGALRRRSALHGGTAPAAAAPGGAGRPPPGGSGPADAGPAPGSGGGDHGAGPPRPLPGGHHQRGAAAADRPHHGERKGGCVHLPRPAGGGASRRPRCFCRQWLRPWTPSF